MGRQKLNTKMTKKLYLMVYKVLFSFVLNYLRKLHKVKNSDVSYDDNNYSPQGQSKISIVSAERKEGVKVGNVFATTKEPKQTEKQNC